MSHALRRRGNITSVSAFAFFALACAAFMCLSFSFPKLASSFSSACTVAECLVLAHMDAAEDNSA